jgi:hypothetical protein
MKFITFTREDNVWDDILTDINIKSSIKSRVSWLNHLQIGIPNAKEKLITYLELKYGDDIINRVCKDFSPIPYVDYQPKPPSFVEIVPQSINQEET